MMASPTSRCSGRTATLLLAAAVAALAAGCAKARVQPPAPPPDLAGARKALEAARAAGAPAKAAEPFHRAESHLKQAERAVEDGEAVQAGNLARLAETEAQWALDKAGSVTPPAAPRRDKKAAELAARLRKLEQEHAALQQRTALLERDLEITETELIRTKSRLRGIETKAEASSAIAEARILMGRLDARTHAAELALCRESVAKAERQIQDENYGAAVFFALKAQNIASKAQ